MSSSTPAGPPHVPAPLTAAAALSAVTDARTRWLEATVEGLRREAFVAAVWLVGSLGRGDADPFSDIDLVAAVDPSTPAGVIADPAGGLRVPGRTLFTRAKPRNAPAGGAYQCVCVELAGLPVLLDVYLWPTASAAVPTGAAVLYHRSGLPPPHTDLAFMALLDRHRSADRAGASPHDPATTLLLVQLAAKYHARGDHPRYAAITQRLHPSAGPGVAWLRHVLHERVGLTAWPGLRAAVAAAHRLLDLAEATAAARDGPAPPG